MPELSELAEDLRHDLSTVAWPEPVAVRRAGDRRTRRTRLVAVAMGAAVALVGGLVVSATGSGTGLPAGTPSPTLSPSSPWSRVLEPVDLGYGFRTISATNDLPPAGTGPMGSCESHALPAAEDSGPIVKAGYRRPDGGEVTEWLVEYRPGSAWAGIRDELRKRVTDECPHEYAVIANSIGLGDQSLLIQDRSGFTPSAGAYEAFVAQDDYLVWVRVEVQLPGVSAVDYAIHVATAAAARVHCVFHPSGICPAATRSVTR